MTSTHSLPKPVSAVGLAALLAVAAAGALPTAAVAQDAKAATGGKVAKIKVFSPQKGQRVGVGGLGWFVDLDIDFDLPARKLAATGFTASQLTGPGVHANAAPFPGSFSPGKDDRLPGLVVLLSTSRVGAGAGQNLANLFNLTGVTNITSKEIEIWDTWIVGAPLFGRNTASTLHVALVGDRNHNGKYDDAPDVVRDSDHDGDVDGKDIEALGLASNVRRVPFFIH